MDKPQPRVNEVSKPFWEGVGASRILLQRCLRDECHQMIFYPRVCCPFCKRAEFEWIEAVGTGRVISHTTIHRTHHDGFNGDAPYVFAAIELTEGVLLYGQMPGAPTDGTLLIGRAVKAAFVPHGPNRQLVVFQLASP
ncbi:MAG: Zn-ribbon domain-containing OB-fold protein [Casimicrobiaceae bacterium]